MNVAAQIHAEQPASSRVVHDAEDLTAFLDPTCAAAIWDRAASPDVTEWLSALDPDHLPNARMIVRPQAVGETVEQLCDSAMMPDGPERRWLINDIAVLAEHFANLMRAPHLRLRLQAVQTNACRKFHVDAITARLVCTYRGTGTQYGIGDAPDQIHTVPTGAPILLRGSLWPPKPDEGLKHRSPPIEGTGETRLVLVLDPITDPDDAV